ncbi:MAG: class I SAM-dependent methyltransferase [Candidatus Bathyarchaeia archaeon]
MTDLSAETHWEKAAKTRMGKYLTRIETDFISRSIDPTSTCMILDVGAEAGRFSTMTAGGTTTAVGLDLDLYSLKRLKLKSRDVAVVRADARKVPLRDGTFDAVLVIEVMDYIPESAEALAECCRILKPECPLILSFGNKSSLKSRLKQLRGKPYAHSYKQMMQDLLKTGFSVTETQGYSWIPLGRTSESRFVPFLAGLERLFGLRRMPSQSPWVILRAVKSN